MQTVVNLPLLDFFLITANNAVTINVASNDIIIITQTATMQQVLLLLRSACVSMYVELM